MIGQIHTYDEPIRLNLKKFPNNDRGYQFFAHEIKNGDDICKMLVGSAHTNVDNKPTYTTTPEQGIQLSEIFSFDIYQQGSMIDVIICRGDLFDPIIGHQFVDMLKENISYDVLENGTISKLASTHKTIQAKVATKTVLGLTLNKPL